MAIVSISMPFIDKRIIEHGLVFNFLLLLFPIYSLRVCIAVRLENSNEVSRFLPVFS
jgi:hypothetical protein